MINAFTADLKSEYKDYNAKRFQQDLLAAVTVTAVALPLALAFGVGSVGSAQAGLITAIVAGILIGALSGGSFQISGPTGAMTAILISVFQTSGLQGVWIAGVFAGIILIICGLLSFGKIVSFIPSPVVTGFTSGIAAVIAIGQIDNFLGVKTPANSSSALKLLYYFTHHISPNFYSILIGLAAIAAILLWPKKLNSIVPSTLIGLVVSLVVSLFIKGDFQVIGDIPKTLISKEHLNFASLNFSTMRQMFFPAISIAALSMIESLLCGEVGANMAKKKFDVNRELVAQGIGNIVVPFFGGVPSTAAIARTSVGIKSGGQTRLVSIMHAIGLLLSMFILAPIMSKIPLASLSGILFVTTWRMNEWSKIRYFFSKRFLSAVLKYLVTLAATVALDLTQAIIIGIVFASIMFIVQITRSTEIKLVPIDKKILADRHGIITEKPLDDVRVAYCTGPLFFATVQQLSRELEEVHGVRVLILSMRGVPLIDISGLDALEHRHLKFKENNGTLMHCGLQAQVRDHLKRSGVVDTIGEKNVFWSAEQAIASLVD